MATPAQNKWMKVIHIAKKELGLSDDEYRAILWGACGCGSSREIKSWEQYKLVLAAFKTLGFRPKRGNTKAPAGEAVSPDSTAADGARGGGHITGRQEYYIRGLWKLASRRKDEQSLRAMVRRIGGVDDISFLPRRKASAVIQALRDITAKAGFNPDGPEGA